MIDSPPSAVLPPLLTRGEARRAPRLGFSGLYGLVLALLCVTLSFRALVDGDDFWAHAAVGRWMWQHGRVPHTTLFLWSAHQPWVWHSWASQLCFFGLMHIGGEENGPRLALLLTCALSSLSFALLWRLWSTRGAITPLTPLLFGFAITIAGIRFHPRPELFSAVFTALLLVFLGRWPEQKRSAWLLPVLFAVWANFHGGVALGLVLLWTATVCDLLQTRASRSARRLAVLALLCTLAINLNPYGLSYWSALRPVGGPMFHQIAEWKPMWQRPALAPEILLGVALLGLLPLFAWLQAPRAERRWTHLAWLLIMAIFLAGARRHLWSYAEVCLVVMALHSRPLEAGQLWHVLRPRNSAPLVLRRAAPILVATCILVWSVALAQPALWRGQALSPSLPVATVRQVQAHHAGPLFNDYKMSSFLEWTLAGRPPLSIDLLNAYPDKVLAEYDDVLHLNARGQHLLHTAIRAVLLPMRDPKITARLRAHLEGSRQWHRVYTDENAALWLRRN